MIGVIAAEIAAVIALFTFNPAMQIWAKGVFDGMRSGIAAMSAPPRAGAPTAAAPTVSGTASAAMPQ